MAGDILPASNTTAPVLGYARYQRRWDRGVMWLVGIVCVTQLLMLPAAAFVWWIIAGYYTAPRPGLPPLTVFDWSADGINRFFGLIVRPLCALILSILTFFALIRPQGRRLPLMLAAWTTVVAFAVFALHQLISKFQDERMQGAMEHVSTFATLAYPLVLQALVLRQSDGKRKPVSAWWIWWLSAGACMLLALPTALNWTFRFDDLWYATVIDFLGWRLNDDWMRTIKGIGEITGAMACFSAFAVTLWTILKGPKGRWALMICAALLVVKAFAVDGASVITTIVYILHNAAIFGGWENLSSELPELGAHLAGFAVAVAFPLAIRMALSLSEVRAQMDGIKTGEGVEGGPTGGAVETETLKN